MRILVKKRVRALPGFVLLSVLWCVDARALQPSLDITQYAHTAWTARDGFLKGAVRSIVQTPDGYLWLGTEFGLVRFDGVRFVSWNPPSGQQLPSTNIRSLLAARDGTLWIGTLEGLASWKDGKIREYPELAHQNVLTLLEDREGSVWAGSFGVPKAKLCAIQRGETKCYGDDGSFGQWVWSLYQDDQGRLWAGAETGLWQWKPGPPKRYLLPYAIDTAQAIVQGDGQGVLLAVGEGIWQFLNEKIEKHAIATPPGRMTLVNIFRDRDGGMWVGTLDQGLMHAYQGKTTTFAQRDGLSSNHILSLFEDQEGNVWAGTTEGLDRFRDTTAFSISVKQGLSSPSVQSVLVARDNSVWLSTLDGLNRWNNGHNTVFWARAGGARESSQLRRAQQPASVFYTSGTERAVTDIADPGLPDNRPGALYEDDDGRIWVSTPKGVTRFENGNFSVVREVPAGWVNAITGDIH
jgi:ligand-binding sensor domain-containing protein